MKLKSIAAASLVEDFNLYPRHRVDESHISDLVRALQAGNTLPPIIVDAATLRVVDGFHRRRAALKHFGDDAKIDVELRKYKDEAALFMDAVALNSSHGRKLDRHDQTRIVLKMRELHLSDSQIAMTLHVPEPTIQYLSVRVVQGPSGPLPQKRGLEHMRGQSLSAEQVGVMESVRSAEAGRLCLELTRLIEADMVDLQDEAIVARLKTLQNAIDRALSAVAA